MTGRLLVERQEMPSDRVLSPRAIEVDLLRAVRTNRLKERLIARQWFQTGPSIPAIPVSSAKHVGNSRPVASRVRFFPSPSFLPSPPVDCQSHDHGATNPTQANSPPPLPCPCQIEAIPQSFSHLGLRLSLPASAIRLRNDQKAQFTHIKLDRQALHSPRDDLHKMCSYSRLTTGFHSSRQGHKILVASIHHSFIYRI